METLRNIKTIRKVKNLTQNQIAVALGIETSAYSKIESGFRELKVSELSIIAHTLGVRVIDLHTYPDIYEKKSENNFVLSEPPPVYEKTETKENPYKLLYELQKEMTEMVQENERLKNDAAIGKIARTG